MEPQGVDVPTLLRRTFPLWLVWILYAAPAVWAIQVFRAVTAMPNLAFNDTTIYDENGTVISSGPDEAESIGWLARIGVGLALNFGIQSPVPSELALLGLGAAAAVTAVWAVRRRSFHLRSVTAVGAVFSAALGIVGVLVMASRDATYETVKQMWGPEGFGLFDGQFIVWGSVGLFGAILTWTFARLGWGPLPMRPLPDPAVVRGGVEDGGSAPAPVGPPVGALGAPSPAPSISGAAGIGAAPTASTGPSGDHTVDLASSGWDTRPELPPDFVAPEAGSSPFERPTSDTSWSEGGARGSIDAAIAEDPLAVYRRPSGPDS